MQRRREAQTPVAILIVSFALALAGCQTVPEKESAELFKAASELETKAAGTIGQIESAAAANDVSRVVHSDDILLSEQSFGHAITPASKIALLQQLHGVVLYTEMLKAVGAGEYRGSFSDAVVKAKHALDVSIASANELKKFVTDDELKSFKSNADSLAAAVAAIGELAIDIRAKKKTSDIIHDTDKDFSAYMLGLANVFSPSSNVGELKTAHGLAGIVVNELKLRKTSIIDQYKDLGAAPEDMAQREKWLAQREDLAREFMVEIRGGDLSVALAIALRDACIAIGKAHNEIAAGKKTGAFQDLQIAVGRVEYLAKVFSDTTKALEK